jgi:hypothetical protein
VQRFGHLLQKQGGFADALSALIICMLVWVAEDAGEFREVGGYQAVLDIARVPVRKFAALNWRKTTCRDKPMRLGQKNLLTPSKSRILLVVRICFST